MFLSRRKLSFSQQAKKLVSPKKGYKRALHYFLWRLKRLPGTPETIALGFAIGIAINFWPILFTHLVLAYVLCRILNGSLIAMFTGTLLGNPWTFAIVYPLMYKIGKVMLGLRPRHAQSVNSAEEVMSKIWPIKSWESLYHAFHEYIIPMMIGGFLLALPCTIFSYYLVRNGVRVYQAQRRRQLLKKFETVENEIEQPQAVSE